MSIFGWQRIIASMHHIPRYEVGRPTWGIYVLKYKSKHHSRFFAHFKWVAQYCALDNLINIKPALVIMFQTKVGLMLGHRLRRWPNINPVLVQPLMFADEFVFHSPSRLVDKHIIVKGVFFRRFVQDKSR